MRLHVGCAMWTHKAWPSNGLGSYAGYCNAVEGNTTFYAIPKRATVESWARQTEPGFRLVLKLPKSITHERRLAGAETELKAFLDAVEPLGPRAHALWIQLPPSFAPTDVEALAGFLRRLPSNHRYAVEVRHRGFFEDARAAHALEQALAPVAGEWIPFDTTVFFQTPPSSDVERAVWGKKPKVPRRSVALTDQPIVRYLGRDSIEATVEGWAHWVGVVAEWLAEGRSPTVFIHTPDDAEALLLARRFHADVRARVPDLEPLPDPVPAEGMLF